jgi:hypothetical protein
MNLLYFLFVEKLNTKIFSIFRCGCGRSLDEHDELVIGKYDEEKDSIKDLKWDSATCTTEDTLTNAYGDIVFNNNREFPAKVYFKSSIHDLRYLL